MTLCTWCKEGRKKTYRLEKKEKQKEKRLWKLQVLSTKSMRTSSGFCLTFSFSSVREQKSSRLWVIFPSCSGWGLRCLCTVLGKKGAPTHKTDCWALRKCQAPRCRVAVCEDLKEPFLLPLINYRENKGFHCLLPTSLLCQLSKNSAPEQRKLPGPVQPQRTPSVAEKQEKGASSFSEGSFVHLLTDPLHCSGHGTGC